MSIKKINYVPMKAKNIYTAIFIMVFATIASAQSEKCYAKSDLRKKNVKYAEWECGKRAGTIDCNEKLSYNQDNNTFLAGIDGTPYNGKCETCHNNGMLERTVSFVNGKEDGIDTTVYESGCPQVIRSHVQGIRNGTWIYYYDSTKMVAWEMNYFTGEQHGRSIFFTKKGDTTLSENYNHGLMHGVQKTYFTMSRLQKEVYYTNGIFDGPFKMYNEKGVIIQDLFYKMGKKNGEFKFLYDDGVLLRTEHWKMDVKDGEFKTFYYEGQIQDVEIYKKGIKEGTAQEFYPDTKLKHKTIYKKGKVIEEYKYDEHGRETYSFGAPEEKDGKEDDAVMSGQSGKKKKKKK